jgi:E3 ubiquitin-protein ligase makorin
VYSLTFPNNVAQECANVIEADMEHSFAVARSQDKQCGICMDTVMERSLPSQRRFGILPNCSHIFCLDCIRKWRQSKQFENKIIRFVNLRQFLKPHPLTIDLKSVPFLIMYIR